MWNKTASTLNLYINGVLDKSQSSATGYTFPTELRYTIGADLQSGTTPPLETNAKCYKGTILIARLYDAVLNANDVSALYSVATNP